MRLQGRSDTELRGTLTLNSAKSTRSSMSYWLMARPWTQPTATTKIETYRVRLAVPPWSQSRKELVDQLVLPLDEILAVLGLAADQPGNLGEHVRQ